MIELPLPPMRRAQDGRIAVYDPVSPDALQAVAPGQLGWVLYRRVRSRPWRLVWPSRPGTDGFFGRLSDQDVASWTKLRIVGHTDARHGETTDQGLGRTGRLHQVASGVPLESGATAEDQAAHPPP